MTTPTKTFKPDAASLAFREDMLQILDKHAGSLSADKMLSLAAYTVGQIIAMQVSGR